LLLLVLVVVVLGVVVEILEVPEEVQPGVLVPTVVHIIPLLKGLLDQQLEVPLGPMYILLRPVGSVMAVMLVILKVVVVVQVITVPAVRIMEVVVADLRTQIQHM
jgi:hypothetical protein